jgi:prepilin-type processing-associated H-X9-DG protein
MSEVIDSHGSLTFNARFSFGRIAKWATGMGNIGSMVRTRDVIDGLGDTILLAEKFVNPDFYLSDSPAEGSVVTYACDDFSGAFSGHSGSIARGWGKTIHPDPIPLPDMEKGDMTFGSTPIRETFGSAHTSGFNAAFCDGSVHTIRYNIESEIYRQLCNRKDGFMTDGKKF